MADTYIRTAETASSTLGVQVSPSAQTSAPIVQLVPLLKAVYSGTLYITSLAISLVKPLNFLIFSPIPVFLYVLAPVIVFLQLALNAFVWSPYRVALYLLDALYPLYVLCGVACITGGILGFAARMISQILVDNVLAAKVEPEQDEKGVKVKTEDEVATTVDVKGKGKKVEKIKFET
ncbi:hypothetical protein CVT26_010669 [Gymnopilus dilepis]|uniref:Uncharacterized protein n=1 Tax=Gymnopilus dilepis TaxID=231916 RepID=A0A409Y0S9_9AGAR|nr:hypothetical protein CVT26_010669 [Gymnopilus dilepis]